jgi:hypothetical protein
LFKRTPRQLLGGAIWGNTAAIIKPSVEITPDASMSAEVPFNSLRMDVNISARILNLAQSFG